MKMNYEQVPERAVGYLTVHLDGPHWKKAQDAILASLADRETAGTEEILYEAVRLMARTMYEAGVKHFALTPVDDPQLDIGNISEEEVYLRYTVILPPVPEVKQYTHFGLKPKNIYIDEIAVNKELEKLGFEVSDAMVQAQGIPNVSTVEEYRKYLKAKLEKEARAKAEADFSTALFKAITDHTEVQVPERMIAQEMELMRNDLVTKLAQQGSTIEEYASSLNQDLDTFARDMYNQAEERVVLQLALRRIAELEHITVSAEELETRKKELAESFHTSTEAVAEHIADSILTENIRMAKVTSFLKEHAA